MKPEVIMKKLSGILLSLLLLIPFNAGAAKKEEAEEPKDLVKVYMFEAGGCPYCEDEMAYLQSLSSYNVKFEIVTKELYVDHVDWAHGKDYDLGVEVAKAFNNAGFADADSRGTPMVIISDLYAATAYNDDLEQYIDQAYEEGDKDIVSCIEAGNSDCLPAAASTTKAKETSTKTIVILAASIGVILVAIIGGYIIYDKKQNK